MNPEITKLREAVEIADTSLRINMLGRDEAARAHLKSMEEQEKEDGFLNPLPKAVRLPAAMSQEAASSVPPLTKNGVQVKKGQIWKDLDKRMSGRELKIIEIGSSHVVAENVHGRKCTIIAIRRMHRHSTGFVLVQDVAMQDERRPPAGKPGNSQP